VADTGFTALTSERLVLRRFRQGDCAAHIRTDDPRQAEIGFTLATEHQGRGYATEAVRRLLDYLLAERDKHRVSATCCTPSCAVSGPPAGEPEHPHDGLSASWRRRPAPTAGRRLGRSTRAATRGCRRAWGGATSPATRMKVPARWASWAAAAWSRAR
jgi:Acetyltransferase (GNAT) domain